jgi:Spy/CpxP family protein refolding chaperone
MLNLKRLVLLAAVTTAALPLAAPAQTSPPATRPQAAGSPGRGMMLMQRVREDLQQLNLTEDQKGKIRDIFETFRDEMQAKRQELQGLTPAEVQAKIQDEFRKVTGKVEDVLMPEQKEKFRKQMDELREDARRGPAAAGAGATTRPGAGGGAGGPGAGMLDRLRDGLQKLELSDEQKQKIKTVFDDMRPKFQQVREQAQGDMQAAREKSRELVGELQNKLRTILTPEQQEKLRSIMRPPGAGGAGGDGPATAPARVRQREREGAGARGRDAGDDTMMSSGAGAGDQMMMSGSAADAMAAGKAPKDVPKAEPAKLADGSIPDGPPVGSPAPQFSLRKLDGGGLVQLSQLKGRVVVLEFGSYSCPAFRDRVSAMEKLKSEYGNRATFFVVYSREAHPAGGWEVDRNKDQSISVEQPRSIDARQQLAKKARESLKITVPMLLDSVGNDTALAYGAGPNSAVVIGRDGTIVAKQQWFDAYGIRRAIDNAAKPATQPVQ